MDPEGGYWTKPTEVKLGQVVLTWAALSQAKIWTDPAYQC